MVEKRKDRVEFLKPQDKIEMGLVDLSESGIAITHPVCVSKGICQLNISGLELKAQTVYCAEQVGAYKIGMKFIDITPDKAAILKGLVDKFSRGKQLEVKANFPS